MAVGFPYPDNVDLAMRLESIVRSTGGVPATIGVIDGVARVGMNQTELTELASTSQRTKVHKVSRRDLGYICGAVRVAFVRSGYFPVLMLTLILGHPGEPDERRNHDCWNYDSGSFGWNQGLCYRRTR